MLVEGPIGSQGFEALVLLLKLLNAPDMRDAQIGLFAFQSIEIQQETESLVYYVWGQVEESKERNSVH